MALLRASYVLLCAVAGGDIQVIIAEKGRVLWCARCSQLAHSHTQAEAARAGFLPCVGPNFIAPSFFLLPVCLYQATLCHQRNEPRGLRASILCIY